MMNLINTCHSTGNIGDYNNLLHNKWLCFVTLNLMYLQKCSFFIIKCTRGRVLESVLGLRHVIRPS